MTLKFDVAGLNKYAFLTEKIVLLRWKNNTYLAENIFLFWLKMMNKYVEKNDNLAWKNMPLDAEKYVSADD